MTNYQSALEKSWRIGKNLRRIRQKKHLTQMRLGRLADVRNVTISRMECGHHLPDIFTLIQLVDALGIKFEDLFSEVDT